MDFRIWLIFIVLMLGSLLLPLAVAADSDPRSAYDGKTFKQLMVALCVADYKACRLAGGNNGTAVFKCAKTLDACSYEVQHGKPKDAP